MTPEELLLKAREVIERDGWHQGYYYELPSDDLSYEEAMKAARTAPVCGLGALKRALSGSATRVPAESDLVLFRQARKLLEAAIGGRYFPYFNDDPKTSKEDVLLAFKKAAGDDTGRASL